MIEAGEEGTSSIILNAPAWDQRWDDWCRVVFPTLEASLLSSGLSRVLGIVCFHPQYETPPVEYLARNRFGHMHSSERIREWLSEQDPSLSDATSDEDLQWAAACQRRSPHAMINVLWASQLEIAESKRKSSVLYSRNIRKALEVGRTSFDQSAQNERNPRLEDRI